MSVTMTIPVLGLIATQRFSKLARLDRVPAAGLTPFVAPDQQADGLRDPRALVVYVDLIDGAVGREHDRYGIAVGRPRRVVGVIQARLRQVDAGRRRECNASVSDLLGQRMIL